MIAQDIFLTGLYRYLHTHSMIVMFLFGMCHESLAGQLGLKQNGCCVSCHGTSWVAVYYRKSPRGLTFTWWGCYGLCLWHNQPNLPTPFYSVLVSISAFVALSTVFYSINSPHNSPLSHSVLPILSLPHRFFQLYISSGKSPSALI